MEPDSAGALESEESMNSCQQDGYVAERVAHVSYLH